MTCREKHLKISGIYIIKKRLKMARCGKCNSEFQCLPDGECWCMEKPCGLPVPARNDVACLCPSCLDKESKDLIAHMKVKSTGVDD